MSELVERLRSIREKMVRVIEERRELRERLAALNATDRERIQQLDVLRARVAELEKENEVLRASRTPRTGPDTLGTKQRIDELVNEIDHCLELLNT
ncbi:MAG: hypothetical protein H6594_02075 [Flavobacteriales bacterium]|nr:hypothetical protein [Flavobacteriales bacterium]